jgi:hypothetical protein
MPRRNYCPLDSKSLLTPVSVAGHPPASVGMGIARGKLANSKDHAHMSRELLHHARNPVTKEFARRMQIPGEIRTIESGLEKLMPVTMPITRCVRTYLT